MVFPMVFTFDDGFSMVFYRWTIGIDDFFNGFSIRDDVFSMVSNGR